MKILLTGVTGYIAQRLLPVLLLEGHHIICCVRDKFRFENVYEAERVTVIEADFLQPETLESIPKDIEAAYYLIHSMSSSTGDFESMEQDCARNFKIAVEKTEAKQVIYLSGITNDEHLSKHLSSRQQVADNLASDKYALTTLKAGIIVGSGSASFEIIRDLVEKLPVMVAPKWVHTRCQPIAIRNVLDFLAGVLLLPETYNKSYDIGGPDILTYKQMLLQFAEVRGLKRSIWTVPIMTPRLSSYWLYFITSTSYQLAKNLVSSMSVEVIAKPNTLHELLEIKLFNYKEAIKLAFDKIEQNQIISTWKSSGSSSGLRKSISSYIEVPNKGVYTDERKMKVRSVEDSLKKLWAIGGKTGWYYGNWLWELRGFLDQIFKGVGMRRGRRSDVDIRVGETIDLWRVLVASKEQKRLLLYAEMKLPGEAWLEFKIGEDQVITQTATFRPLGLRGRAYWFSVWIFHGFIFKGMLKAIAK